MNNKVLKFAVILLGVCLSLGTGIYIGATRTLDFYFNEDVNSSATELSAKIKTLEMIKKGEIEKAGEFLEGFVDVHLGSLGVSAQNKLLKDKSKLLDAIQKAKEYRKKNPGHKINPTLNNSVVNAFGLVGK